MTIEKRYVNELNKEELVKVFNTNEKLRQEIMDDASESELFWIDEKLDYVRSSMRDWSIGAYQYSYIKIGDTRAFLEGLQTMDNEVPAFGDDKAKQIYEAVELCRQMDEVADTLNEMDYDEEREDYLNVEGQLSELEEQFEAEVQRLADLLAKELQRDIEACYDEENALDYFLNFFADERMETGMWVNENYELFKDVAYVKSYK